MLLQIQFYCEERRKEGLETLLKAASQQNADAMHALAIIHFNGSGGQRKDKDLTKTTIDRKNRVSMTTALPNGLECHTFLLKHASILVGELPTRRSGDSCICMGQRRTVSTDPTLFASINSNSEVLTFVS